MKRKQPPFSRTIENFKNADIIVCTGSEAWNKAKSKTWQARTAKLVMPFHSDPSLLIWPVAGRYVQVWTCGKPENFDQLLLLAQCLLNDGADKVLLLDIDRPMTVIKRKEAA